MELKNFFAQDLQGNVIPSPTVTVYLAKTTTLATGLEDKDGNALTNPFTGGGSGQVTFAAPDGNYDLKIEAPGRVTTMRVRFIDSVAGSAQVLRDELASNAGSNLVSYTPAGPESIPTTVQAKLRITASDVDAVSKESTQPAYAAVSVNLTRTKIDRHAFEDWSHLATTDTGQGYCSFDAKPTMTTAQNQDHFVGYQSRPIYSGVNNLNSYMYGYDTAMVHNGTGTVKRVAGMHLRETGGAGPITENYGLIIDTMTRGLSNAGIFSGPGNYHYFGGDTGEIETGVVKAKALNFGVDKAGKVIVYGYGSVGQENFGTHVFYNGKSRILATLDEASGLAVDTAIISNYTITPGRFTYAQLPTAYNGSTAYCTNGRKVGEAAGAGTGVPVYFSNGAWRVFSTDAIVTV